MSVIAILAAGTTVVGIWYWCSRRRGAPPREKRAGGRRAHGAVEIQAGLVSCEGVRALVDKRFLSGEAPTLPLPECTEKRCRCTFKKLADRRQDSRRWTDEGIATPIFGGVERRTSGDRRRGTPSGRR